MIRKLICLLFGHRWCLESDYAYPPKKGIRLKVDLCLRCRATKNTRTCLQGVVT